MQGVNNNWRRNIKISIFNKKGSDHLAEMNKKEPPIWRPETGKNVNFETEITEGESDKKEPIIISFLLLTKLIELVKITS